MTDIGSNLDTEVQVIKGSKKVFKPETTRIILEENADIPPTGLFVGFNGVGFLIRPGEEVDVPAGVLEILDNAITSVPQTDPTSQQVIGYRDRMRYPYRVVKR